MNILRRMLVDAAMVGWLWAFSINFAFISLRAALESNTWLMVLNIVFVAAFALWGWFKFRSLRKQYKLLEELDRGL